MFFNLNKERMKLIVLILACIGIFSCAAKKESLPQKISVNYTWLDSVRQSADTVYVKKYGTTKFANATYYNNQQLDIVCQVMRDSSDSIRQIIMTKKGQRIFVAEYYANGQLIAKLPLDSFGQYHGPSKYYYQNGFIESEGGYEHGLKKGAWENYSSKGKSTGTSQYDSNGNVLKHTSE
jgi:antitoxin component YwqK of YwqJK toxin-antitoxin module